MQGGALPRTPTAKPRACIETARRARAPGCMRPVEGLAARLPGDAALPGLRRVDERDVRRVRHAAHGDRELHVARLAARARQSAHALVGELVREVLAAEPHGEVDVAVPWL